MIPTARCLLPPVRRAAILPWVAALAVLCCLRLPAAGDGTPPVIPIAFELSEPATVTVVIDRPDGTRVRNLIGAEAFPAGHHTVGWDGLDEGIVRPAPHHGIYDFTRALVTPGDYVARIVTHRGLDARYEFTVYPNTGRPPWLSTELSGGWLADHSPPEAVLFIPAATAPGGRDQMLIGSRIAEAGDGLVWVDLDGVKQGGYRTIGGTWTGASHLTRDRGPNAVPGMYAYTGVGFRSDTDKSQGEIRIMALTTHDQDAPLRGRENQSAHFYRQVLRLAVTDARSRHVRAGEVRASAELTGLAVHDGILIAGLGDTGELLVARVADRPSKRLVDSAEVLGRLPAEALRDLAFDLQGRVLTLDAGGVRRYQLTLGEEPALTGAETLIDGGLDEPVRLTVADDGRLYVSEAGGSHSVKVFDPDGRLLRTIGEPGMPAVGLYHPLRMNNPAGATVDARGNLWVAERNHAPKRVGVWSAEGKLLHAFIGPSKYGGGGFIDPQDRTRMYVAERNALLEFRLDWDKGAAELVAVPYRNTPETEPFFFDSRTLAPQNVFEVRGSRYFSNSYSASPTSAGPVATLWRQSDDLTLRPVAVVAAASNWPLLLRDEFMARVPPELIRRRRNPKPGESDIESISASVAWSDLNGNGRPEPDELSFLPLDSQEQTRRIVIDADLHVFLASPKRLFRLPPSAFGEDGTPRYDMASAETVLAAADGVYRSGSDWLRGADGTLIGIDGPITGFRPDGTVRWQYHNQWPSLHAGHRAPRRPEYPGQILATTRALGWPQDLPDPTLGQVWAVNSDKAVMYFFTTDGFFLGTVGGFSPEAPQWRFPRLERNAPLNEANFIGEHFWPTFTRTSDGNYYMVAGKNHASIVRVDGFDTLRRLPEQRFSVTSAQLERAAAHALAATARPTETTDALRIPVRSGARQTSGRLDDWEGSEWLALEHRNVTFGNFSQGFPFPWVEVSLAVAADRLHVMVRTFERDLLVNTAENPSLLFKTGGALDIQIGADTSAESGRKAPVAEDRRLLVAQDRQGKPIAVLYEPVAPEAPAELAATFSSPWRDLRFDRVEEVSGEVANAVIRESVTLTSPRQATQTRTLRQETWEVSATLETLGFKPSSGKSLRGDIGILIGSSGETVQRLYWRNPLGGLVSDIPGEAMLSPAFWGVLEFIEAGDDAQE